MVFESDPKQKTLKSVIKRRIGNRVGAAFALLLLLIWSLINSEVRVTSQQFTKSLSEWCHSLEDFAIGQVFADNEQAVYAKVDQFNEDHPKIHLSWVKTEAPATEATLNWSLPLSWTYTYPLRLVGGKYFGKFIVQGSYLADRAFLNELILRVSLLIIISSMIFWCLYPLWNKIPEELIFKPIDNLINTFKDQTTNLPNLNSKDQPEELKIIKHKILDLIAKEKESIKAEAMNKVRSKLAHDLKSPLEVINALERNKTRAEVSWRVKTMALLRMAKIAQDLLVPNSESKNDISDVLVADTLSVIISEKQVLYADRNARLELAVPAELEGTFARINPFSFQRALSNIIDNAFDALDKADSLISVILKKIDKNLIEIEIHDNGKGISEERLSSVGAIGITDKKGGHGLGLSQAQEAMAEASGSFHITSKVGQGTSVFLGLPICPPPIWFTNSIKVQDSTKFVILDDDPSVHQLWKDHLVGYEIVHHHVYDRPIFEKFSADQSNFFLVDYQFDHGETTGLDVIRTHNLNERSILVTSYFSDQEVQRKAVEIKAKILPKHLIKNLALDKSPIKPDLTPDIVLIDDVALTASMWNWDAEEVKAQILWFPNKETFLSAAVPKNVPICIDFELIGTNGCEVAIDLAAQGYSQLHLVTGTPKENLPVLPSVIKSVRGKGFPREILDRSPT